MSWFTRWRFLMVFYELIGLCGWVSLQNVTLSVISNCTHPPLCTYLSHHSYPIHPPPCPDNPLDNALNNALNNPLHPLLPSLHHHHPQRPPTPWPEPPTPRRPSAAAPPRARPPSTVGSPPRPWRVSFWPSFSRGPCSRSVSWPPWACTTTRRVGGPSPCPPGSS